jgi:hypothetical protein
MTNQRPSTPPRRLPPHSAFGSWFKQQYGGAPSPRKRERLRIKVAELETALSGVRVELNMEDYLQDCWTNALRGWNARKQ